MKTRIGKVLFLCFALLLFACSDGHDNPAPTPQPAQPVTGSAYLSWNPVTTYTDGSLIIDLGGYNVYQGNVPSMYKKTITIAAADLVSMNSPTYVAENLPPATYYFAITAFDSSGAESALSQEVHKTI